MKLNEKLKALRLEKGLSQTELAQKLNLGQTTIAAYENGVHDPQIFSLISYADFFQCSIDYLVGRENEFGIINVFNCETLTESEKELLLIFQTINPELQKMLLQNAKIMKTSDLNK